MMFNNDEGNEKYSNNTREKQWKTDWLPWILVAGMGMMLVYQYLGTPGSTGNIAPVSNGFNWLLFLPGLICPLMMLFMMSGHGHGHKHTNGNDQGQSGQGGCCGGHQANKAAGK